MYHLLDESKSLPFDMLKNKIRIVIVGVKNVGKTSLFCEFSDFLGYGCDKNDDQRMAHRIETIALTNDRKFQSMGDLKSIPFFEKKEEEERIDDSKSNRNVSITSNTGFSVTSTSHDICTKRASLQEILKFYGGPDQEKVKKLIPKIVVDVFEKPSRNATVTNRLDLTLLDTGGFERYGDMPIASTFNGTHVTLLCFSMDPLEIVKTIDKLESIMTYALKNGKCDENHVFFIVGCKLDLYHRTMKRNVADERNFATNTSYDMKKMTDLPTLPTDVFKSMIDSVLSPTFTTNDISTSRVYFEAATKLKLLMSKTNPDTGKPYVTGMWFISTTEKNSHAPSFPPYAVYKATASLMKHYYDLYEWKEREFETNHLAKNITSTHLQFSLANDNDINSTALSRRWNMEGIGKSGSIAFHLHNQDDHDGGENDATKNDANEKDDAFFSSECC